MENLDFDRRKAGQTPQVEKTQQLERSTAGYDTFGRVEARVLQYDEGPLATGGPGDDALAFRNAGKQQSAALLVDSDFVAAGDNEEHDGANRLQDLNDQVSVMDNQSQYLGNAYQSSMPGGGNNNYNCNVNFSDTNEIKEVRNSNSNAHNNSKRPGFGIESAVGFADGRAHFVFSDRTSLILHPKGDCFTYFRRDGKKLRQLVKFAINQSVSDPDAGGGPLEKLLLALQLFNTYSDQPVVSRRELFEESVKKPSKLTKVSWPGEDNVDEYSWVDEEGNLHLRSVDDGLCEVILAANNLHFRVHFLYLVASKSAQWVTTDPNQAAEDDYQQFDDGASAGRSVYTSSAYNKSQLGRSAYRQGSRVMKMMHEYARIEQIHSVAQCSDRWVYPLALLMKLKKVDLRSELVIEPIPALLRARQATEIIPGREYQTLLPVDLAHTAVDGGPTEQLMDATLTSGQSAHSKYAFDALKSVNGLMDASRLGQGPYDEMAQKSLLQMSIKSGKSVQEMLQENSHIQSLISADQALVKQVWSQDNISPASFMYSYRESNILFEWNPLCMTRLLGPRGGSKGGESLEVMIHRDGSIFFVKEYGAFISHLQSNLKDIAPLRNFTCDTIPFVVHCVNEESDADLKRSSSATYNPQEMLAPAFLILKQPYMDQKVMAEGSKSALNQEMDDISKASLMAGNPDSIYKEMTVKDLGHFTAYQNGAIKAAFQDRTIVRMMNDCKIIRLLTRKGDELLFNLDHPNTSQADYQDYIKVSQEFFEWAFLSTEEKQAKQHHAEAEKAAIQNEIDRIQRTVMLIDSDKNSFIPSQQPDHQNQQYPPVQQQSLSDPEHHAAQEIEGNSRQIDEIQKLLDSIK